MAADPTAALATDGAGPTTELVEVPAEYIERVPADARRARYAQLKQPAVAFETASSGSDRLRLLAAAMAALGEPEGLRCFTRENAVALLPADPDHPNAYSVFGQSSANTGTRGYIAAGWLTHELAMDTQPTPACYPLERDGELWVLDFEAEPLEVFDA